LKLKGELAMKPSFRCLLFVGGRMRRCTKQLLLIAVMIAFAISASGATLEKEGKAWLAAHAAPATINVSGTWHSEKWGDIVLYRDAASGQLKGHADEWHIHGVVGGNRVFLLFTSFGDVNYSAILMAASDGSLDGSYSNKLMSEGDKGEPMHLARIAEGSGTQPPAAGSEAQSGTGLAASAQPTAKIVVYRVHAFLAGAVSPYVILDNETMAWIPNGEYLTLLVTPGKHTIILARSMASSLGILRTSDALPVYASADQTSYAAVEASLTGFSARLAEPEEARKDLKKLSPAKAKVIDPEVSDRVSVEPVR
jgi:hypothetical protein